MRLVYYSLTLPREVARPDLLWQLETSVASLRRFNQSVRVVLFSYGELPAEFAARLGAYGVEIYPQGSYEARLAELCPRGWQVLAQYPLLHKFLNFGEIAALRPDQVLFLDCDTLFFHDVDRLFERYAHLHCAAREEPTCRRSHYGYDPSYLDEDFLAAVAASQGLAIPPPFNLGVVLFNHGIWEHLAALAVVLTDYAWRLGLGMALAPPRPDQAQYGEAPGIELLRAHLGTFASAAELASALPYPSANRWIWDQVTLWLTLGHLPGLAYGDFARGDVLQNGEFTAERPEEVSAVLCHYFSHNRERIDHWVRQNLAAPSTNPTREMSHDQP